MTTSDDGVGSTELIEDDDVINMVWAIPTNMHTEELAEYEAGVVTYYRDASIERTDLPPTKWSITQTLTKVMNVTARKIVAGAIIPTQAGAITKEQTL